MSEPVLWKHDPDKWVVPVSDRFNPDVMTLLGFLDRRTMEIKFIEGYKFDSDRSALALAYSIDKEDPSKVRIREVAVVPRGNAIFEKREG